MNNNISPLYSTLPASLESMINHAIEKGLAENTSNPIVFFRADDIGVPSHSFFHMIELFKKFDTPLCLAVVPAWLTEARFKALICSADSKELFCWHQHGWRHKNHEERGKKQEFGESRATLDIHTDLKNGKIRLTKLLGKRFFPFFTPPWNRCGASAIKSLIQLNFNGISRSKNAFPLPPENFPDFQVNVDLHTRKEENPAISLNTLLEELQSSVRSDSVGIMLHHQRMNSNSFLLLEYLLKALKNQSAIQPTSFSEMIKDQSLAT